MPVFGTYWSGLSDGTLSDAGKVSITDTNSAYTSTNVDGALDEIGGRLNSIWLSPELFYGTSVNAVRTEIVEGVPGWDMGDADTAGQANIASVVDIPSTWTTYDVEMWWTNLSANSGNVTFQCNVISLGDGDTVASPPFNGNNTIAAPSQLVLEVSTIRSGVTATSGDKAVILVARTLLNSTLNGNVAILGVRLVKAS